MKKLGLCLMMVAFLVFVVAAAETVWANQIQVTVDGERVQFDGQQPVIVDGRTLVPVRGVFEELGFEVSWNSATRQVTLEGSGHTVLLTIDSRQFTVNGAFQVLDVAAQIIGGSTMLPIRAVLEAVGYYLDWDSQTQTVLVSSTPLRQQVGGIFTSNDGRLFAIFSDGSTTTDIGDLVRPNRESSHDAFLTQIENSSLTGANPFAGGVFSYNGRDVDSMGPMSIFGLTADNRLYAFGGNHLGQLGLGSTQDEVLEPELLLAHVVNVFSFGNGWNGSLLHGYSDIWNFWLQSSGFAIQEDGTLWAWGQNGGGRLGLGTDEFRSTPDRVMGSVYAMFGHWTFGSFDGELEIYVLQTNGTLWRFGNAFQEPPAPPVIILENVRIPN